MNVTLIRTAMLYFFVTLGIRLMGKRQIGDMQPNELVVTLLISEIAAIPLQDTSQPVLNGVAAIFMLVILEIVLSVLAMKFAPIRKMMSGTSVLVIQNGVIDQAAMRKVRMTVIDLIELLRGQGYFEVDQIAYAVLEVNGDLSVIPKSAYRPTVVSDLATGEPADEAMPLPVISDGKLVKDSLHALKIDKEQVLSQIGNRKVTQIFLMTLDRLGNQWIVMKEDAS